MRSTGRSGSGSSDGDDGDGHTTVSSDHRSPPFPSPYSRRLSVSPVPHCLLDLGISDAGVDDAPPIDSASAAVPATVTVTSKARGGSTALDRILSLRSSSACSSRRSTTPPPFSPPPLPRPPPLVVVRRSLAPLRSLAPPPPTRLHDPRPRCVRSDDVAAQHRPRLSPPHHTRRQLTADRTTDHTTTAPLTATAPRPRSSTPSPSSPPLQCEETHNSLIIVEFIHGSAESALMFTTTAFVIQYHTS